MQLVKRASLHADCMHMAAALQFRTITLILEFKSMPHLVVPADEAQHHVAIQLDL